MHSWNLCTTEAIAIQKNLASKLILKYKLQKINHIAGVDLAYDEKSNLGFCAVVVFNYPELKLEEIYLCQDKAHNPKPPLINQKPSSPKNPSF